MSSRLHDVITTPSRPQRRNALRLPLPYLTPGLHERACQAVATASQAIRPAPAAVRYARSVSAQPNAVARIMMLIDQLAALGAPASDLRAIPLALDAHIARRAARPAFRALLLDAQRAENAENVHDLTVNEAAPDSLLAFARAKRAEAALDLECAIAAEMAAEARS